MKSTATMRIPALGLRSNTARITVLVTVYALVEGIVGQEQTVPIVLTHTEFGLNG